MWWTTVWNDGKDEKIIESCGYEQLPQYLTEVVKASNRPAAAVESLRNELVKDFGSTLNLIAHAFPQLKNGD